MPKNWGTADKSWSDAPKTFDISPLGCALFEKGSTRRVIKALELNFAKPGNRTYPRFEIFCPTLGHMCVKIVGNETFLEPSQLLSFKKLLRSLLLSGLYFTRKQILQKAIPIRGRTKISPSKSSGKENRSCLSLSPVFLAGCQARRSSASSHPYFRINKYVNQTFRSLHFFI